MTSKTEEWLNSNCYRAYPLMNDSRSAAAVGSGLPLSAILDVFLCDYSSDSGGGSLLLSEIDIGESGTDVAFMYAGKQISVYVPVGEGMYSASVLVSGWDGPAILCGTFSKPSGSDCMSLIFPASERPEVIPTRVLRLPGGSGINSILVNGSDEDSMAGRGSVTGRVHLRDGYRTQPVISGGKVIVRVGAGYGKDPCMYGSQGSAYDCSGNLLFFCGQNGGTSGNITLSGGAGVSVSSGTYTVTGEMSSCIANSAGELPSSGEEIPSIEISAGSGLLALRAERTTDGSEGSSNG